MKISVLCLLACVTSSHAGEIIPSQIPASAKWQLHADLEAMRLSDTGKSIFARIEKDHGAQLRAFKRMFSLHPLNDLDGVTMYGDGKPDRAVALLAGSFDRGHLEDLVQAAEKYSAESKNGVTIHSWQDKGILQHAAFVNDGLLVFSRQDDLLRQALDVLQANAAGQADPFFKEEGDKLLISASAKISEIEMPEDAARLLKMARTLKIGASEKAGRFNIIGAIETGNAPQADRLRRMLDGVIALAQLGDPKLDGLDLQADFGTTTGTPGMTATLSLPIAEWIALMEKDAATKAKKDH